MELGLVPKTTCHLNKPAPVTLCVTIEPNHGIALLGIRIRSPVHATISLYLLSPPPHIPDPDSTFNIQPKARPQFSIYSLISPVPLISQSQLFFPLPRI